jgi:membrane protein DedA with SNARE-associated domain
MVGVIANIIDYLVTTLGSLGYLGIFILMTIESTIFPLPSEVILIPQGYMLAKLGLTAGSNPLLIVLFAALGSVAGALLCYYFSLYVGRRLVVKAIDRYGKFIFLKESSLESADRYFKQHGEITIFVSRLLPVIRHLISFPAGFAKMNIYRFILYTFIGAAIWSGILLYIGYVFGNIVSTALLSYALGAFCLVLIIFYILIKKYLAVN